jgi:hypothetical protein
MKKVFLLCIGLALSGLAVGQSVEYSLRLKGIGAFPSIQNTIFNPSRPPASSSFWGTTVSPDEVLRRTLVRPGAEAGLDITLNPDKRLHFRSGLHVQLFRYKVEEEVIERFPHHSTPAIASPSDRGVNTALVYTSVPIIAEYKVAPKLNAFAGGQAFLLTHSTQAYKAIRGDFNPSSPTYGTYWEEPVRDKSGNGFSRFHTAVTCGASYQLSSSIKFEASYMRGLTDIYTGSEGNRNSEFSAKMNAVSLGVIYKL